MHLLVRLFMVLFMLLSTFSDILKNQPVFLSRDVMLCRASLVSPPQSSPPWVTTCGVTQQVTNLKYVLTPWVGYELGCINSHLV